MGALPHVRGVSFTNGLMFWLTSLSLILKLDVFMLSSVINGSYLRVFIIQLKSSLGKNFSYLVFLIYYLGEDLTLVEELMNTTFSLKSSSWI